MARYVSRRKETEWLAQSAGDTPHLCDLSLGQFIPRVSPAMQYPYWLYPLAEVLEEAELALDGDGEPVKVVVSVPPQHGKSTLLVHWLARLIGRRPELRHAYCAYSQALSRRQSRACRRIAKSAGIALASKNLDDWVTRQGGGCAWTSILGTLTGLPISGVGIIDDPIKDRAQAESATLQASIWDWYTDVFLSRIHPTASQIVVATRWAQGDLSGRLLDLGGWRQINLPAIDPDTGAALWPEGRPLEWLAERRRDAGEYGWASMYMGSPVPRGGAIFARGQTIARDGLPTMERYSMGIDVAYSLRTRSDYCAAVVLGWHEGTAHVVDMIHTQSDIPAFARDVQTLATRYRCVPRWHASGQERAIADMLGERGLRVDARPAVADKFTRAQPAAAAWNAGKIKVLDAKWTHGFLAEVERFSGAPTQHDDQVDALVSAYDAGRRIIADPPRAQGARVFTAPKGGRWG